MVSLNGLQPAAKVIRSPVELQSTLQTAQSACRSRVLYSTDQLLEKNKDYVVAENAALVASSASAFVRGLLVVPAEDGAEPTMQRRNAFKLNSVGAQFRTQVWLRSWQNLHACLLVSCTTMR